MPDTKDRFPTEDATTSFRDGFMITPQDDVVLEVRPKGLYVSANCDLATKMNGVDDPVVTWYQLAPGIPHPISPAIVMATGTTENVMITGG